MDKEELLNYLEFNTRVLKTAKLKKAFSVVDRKDFVLPEYEDEAYEDYAVPIGFNQTISQPTTVSFMLELLNPKVGDRILDVGSGSGWTTALLTSLVGESGEVLGVDIIPGLVAYGQRNLLKYNFKNARVMLSPGFSGLASYGPFDKILVSASAEDLPSQLVTLLKDGGVMVIPIGEVIYRVEKRGSKLLEKRYPGFAFVPLIC